MRVAVIRVRSRSQKRMCEAAAWLNYTRVELRYVTCGRMPVRVLVLPDNSIVNSNDYRDVRRFKPQTRILAGTVSNNHHYFTRSSGYRIAVETKSDRN